jgi:hypothetical protein
LHPGFAIHLDVDALLHSALGQDAAPQSTRGHFGRSSPAMQDTLAHAKLHLASKQSKDIKGTFPSVSGNKYHNLYHLPNNSLGFLHVFTTVPAAQLLSGM